jgi:hypothetical protein
MDEQEQAQQALKEMFRRDQTEAVAHPTRKPRGRLDPRARAWLLAVALVIFILFPTAFIVIYPRFGPVDTMTSFCTAESDGEYDTAYALLSKGAQQRVSLDAFTQASHNVNLMSCSPSHGIPIIFGGTRASLDVNYQYLSSGDALDGSMTFVREHGEWRVDSMTPDFLNLSS